MDARSSPLLKENSLMLLKQYETILLPHYQISKSEILILHQHLAEEVWNFLEMTPPLSMEVIKLLELAKPHWSKVKALSAARYLWTHGLKNLEPELLIKISKFIQNLEPEINQNEIKASLNIRAAEVVDQTFPLEYQEIVKKYVLN